MRGGLKKEKGAVGGRGDRQMKSEPNGHVARAFCGCLSKGGLKRGLKGGCEGVKGAKVTGEGAV